MKRKPVLITLGITLIVVGAVWVYQFTQKNEVTTWDLISNDAVLVVELPEFNSIHIKIEELPFLKTVLSSSELLDGIFNSKFFQGNKVFISIQPTARDNFGFLVYTELNSSDWKNDIKRIGLPFSDSSLRKRVYNGIEINEQVGKEPQFSFAIIENILVMSESSFLLEGVLRLHSTGNNNLFRDKNISLFKLPTLKSDDGNIYINVSNLSDFMALFLQPNSIKATNENLHLNGGALADIKVSNKDVLLNGFLISSEVGLLHLFEKQEPQPIDVDGLISNKVATATHFGISNPAQWFDDQAELIKVNKATSTDSLIQEMLRLSVSVESLRKAVGNQFVNCYLGKGSDVVNILKLSEDASRISVFDELSSKLAEQKRDSLYTENYAGYQIRLIDYKNFLSQLFYPLAPPSEQTFFVQIGQFLILSESVELIKGFIDDVDTEDTWGKSVEWSKFLSSSLQESNINIFFDGKLTSVFLQDKLNPKWRAIFNKNNFLNIDKGAFQLSRLETNYYLNTSFQFSPSLPAQGNLERITYGFGSNIVTPPKIVRNHISKEIELVIQDSLSNIYLLSKDIKTLWKQSVDDQVVDGVKQIDFFANGKLQLFFTTVNAIHIIDRLGRYVEGYPKKLDLSNKVEFSQVVDYDRSKRYRYLVTEEKGNLILTDKVGNQLEGWNPKKLNGKMLSAAKHYRVLGKDYFLATTQTGSVNLMNRRGELMKCFPMDLTMRPSGEVSITIGNSLSSSYFTAVSKDGLKVQFGVDGQIRKKEVLLKKAASSEFSLVKSTTEETYVFLRVDPGKVGILDTDGNTLIEVENPGSTKWKLIYIENRLKERFYCLYDEQQNFSYYFDFSGQLLLPQPLESTQLPTLFFNEKQKSLSIYNVDHSNLSLVSIKR
ncbi:MAG: hypothetical protein R2804_05440 [Cyclobacteriaceae bacterium]